MRGKEGGGERLLPTLMRDSSTKRCFVVKILKNSKLSEIKFRLLTNQKLERGEHKVQPTLEVRVFASFIVMLKVNVK